MLPNTPQVNVSRPMMCPRHALTVDREVMIVSSDACEVCQFCAVAYMTETPVAYPSAVGGDYLDMLDEPIPYRLTAKGEAAR